MKVEFRKSFEKDLGKLRDVDLLQRIQAVIEEVETIDSLSNLTNIKKLKQREITIASELVIMELDFL